MNLARRALDDTGTRREYNNHLLLEISYLPPVAERGWRVIQYVNQLNAFLTCDVRDMHCPSPDRDQWPLAESHTRNVKRECTTRSGQPSNERNALSVDGCGRLRYRASSTPAPLPQTGSSRWRETWVEPREVCAPSRP